MDLLSQISALRRRTLEGSYGGERAHGHEHDGDGPQVEEDKAEEIGDREVDEQGHDGQTQSSTNAAQVFGIKRERVGSEQKRGSPMEAEVELGNVYTVRLNSGLFGVPWQLTEKVLRECGCASERWTVVADETRRTELVSGQGSDENETNMDIVAEKDVVGEANTGKCERKRKRTSRT